MKYNFFASMIDGMPSGKMRDLWKERRFCYSPLITNLLRFKVSFKLFSKSFEIGD